VTLDDFLADGEADARAGVFGAGVQPLKHLEDPLGVLRLNADAVIADGEQPALRMLRGGHRHPRRLIAMELDGVADEVLKELHELAFVGHDGRQPAMRHRRALLVDGLRQVGQRPLKRGLAVRRRKRRPTRADP
jgi:hypothetical protein